MVSNEIATSTEYYSSCNTIGLKIASNSVYVECRESKLFLVNFTAV